MPAVLLGPPRFDCLRLVSGSENLKIPPTTGELTIPGSSGRFTYVDTDFVNWGLDKLSLMRPETNVQVFEMVNAGTFAQAFKFPGSRFRDLCFTQHQIVSFVDNHHRWLLRSGRSTFFLTGGSKGLFVVGVVSYNGGWGMQLHPFYSNKPRVWEPRFRRRVVVPQLSI